MTVPSPCVRACCLDRDDICIGCGRRLDEITGWQAASDSRKQEIVAAAHERLALRQHKPQSTHQPTL